MNEFNNYLDLSILVCIFCVLLAITEKLFEAFTIFEKFLLLLFLYSLLYAIDTNVFQTNMTFCWTKHI